MSNVYLIGMMGSGKSVTGKRLATLLNCRFVDLDELIQERTKQSIAEIFQKKGEPYFRDEEAAALTEVAKVQPRVIATGGGTVLKPANLELMKATGKLVYLETGIETLWIRVKDKKDRPLLKSEDPKRKLIQIFAERCGIYEKAADLRVNTDGRTAADVAKEIFDKLGNA
jgi:shikimate kinase